MKPEFFESQAAFRAWLKKHHNQQDELWVGFHKKASGVPSITYPQALDEALCFGWIDGVRKSLDEDRYVIRFTPRRPVSRWSAVNIRKARALIEKGLMQPAGLKAFQARTSENTEDDSSARKSAQLHAAFEKALKAHTKAWAYFQSRPPSYRQVVIFWIMSAKREETRRKRLSQLIKDSAAGRIIPPLSPTAKRMK